MNDEALYVAEHPADDPDAPLIVLVHGVLDSSLSFTGVVEELVPEFTVVTYDRRGWGRSQHVSPAETLDEHAHDVIAAMGGRRATVVAHSYGGAVGLLAASLRPDLVAALAVFEPTVAWAEWWPDADTIAKQAVHVQHHFRAGLEGRPRPTPESARAIRRSCTTTSPLSRPRRSPLPTWRCRASSGAAR